MFDAVSLFVGFGAAVLILLAGQRWMHWRTQRQFEALEQLSAQAPKRGELATARRSTVDPLAPAPAEAESLIALLNAGLSYSVTGFLGEFDALLRERGLVLVGAELALGDVGFLGPNVKLRVQVRGSTQQLQIDAAPWQDGLKPKTLDDLHALMRRRIVELTWIRPLASQDGEASG